MPKIAELTIEITNNANKARVSLDKLTGSLEKVKQAKQNLSFSDVNMGGLQTLYKYVSSLNRILDPLVQKCSTVTQAFSAMGATSASQLAKVSVKAEELKTKMANTAETSGRVASGLQETSGAAESVSSTMESATYALDRLNGKIKEQSSALGDLHKRYVAAVVKYGENSAEARELAAQISDLSSYLNENKAIVESAEAAYKKLTNIEQKAEKQNSKLANSNKGLSSSTKSVSNGLSGLIKQFGRLFKLKVMRQIVRNVMEGFTEGTKNLYEYSRALASIDSANFKNTMDGYASAFLRLKNSVAAAVAPLLQQFLPVIQQVVAWVVKALEVVNQFISALQGKSTYTRATNYMVEWGDATSDAAGKAKELERTLLGFDEINKLNDASKGSSGGSSSVTPDYSQMFEEAGIEDGITKALERIKPLLNAVKRVGDALKKIWESDLVQTLVKGALILTLDSVVTVLDLLADALDVIASLLEGDFPGALKKLGHMYLHLVANALTTIKDFGLMVLNVFENIGDGLWVFVRGVLQPVQHNIVDWIDKTVAGVIRGFYSILSSATDSLNRIIRAINNSGIAKAMGIHFNEIEYDFDAMADYSVNKWHETTEGWKVDADTASEKFHNNMEYIKEKFGGSFDTMISEMRKYEDVWDLVMDGNWDAAIELYTKIENQNAATENNLEKNPLKINADNSQATGAIRSLTEKMNEYRRQNYTAKASLNTSDAVTSANTLISTYSSKRLCFDAYASTGDASKALWAFYNGWNGTKINLQAQINDSTIVNPFKAGTTMRVMAYAEGGFPDYGSMFIAGESGAGAEMVGNINGRTGVASQGEITGIRDAVDASSQREADLLSEQNAILREIASKSGGEISVNSIMSAMNRVNRRSGRAVVQMGQ